MIFVQLRAKSHLDQRRKRQIFRKRQILFNSNLYGQFINVLQGNDLFPFWRLTPLLKFLTCIAISFKLDCLNLSKLSNQA